MVSLGRAAALALVLASGLDDSPDMKMGAPFAEAPAPTAFACSLDSLVSGAECVFEGDAEELAAPWSVARFATALCTLATRRPGRAHPDAVVQQVCEAEVARSVAVCTDEPGKLLDGAGRFLPSARECYGVVGDALARARTLAATLGPCCRCLEGARCAEVRACVEGGLGQTLSPSAAKCAAGKCSALCDPYLAPGAPPAPRPPEPDPHADHTSHPVI